MSTQINIFVGNQQLLQKVKARVAANANALAERTRLKKDLEKIRPELEPALQEELRSSGNVDPFKEQGVFDGNTAYAGIGATRKKPKEFLPRVISVANTGFIEIPNTSANAAAEWTYKRYRCTQNYRTGVLTCVVIDEVQRNTINFADVESKPVLFDSTGAFDYAGATKYKQLRLPFSSPYTIKKYSNYANAPSVFWVTKYTQGSSGSTYPPLVSYGPTLPASVSIGTTIIQASNPKNYCCACNGEYVYISFEYEFTPNSVVYYEDLTQAPNYSLALTINRSGYVTIPSTQSTFGVAYKYNLITGESAQKVFYLRPRSIYNSTDYNTDRYLNLDPNDPHRLIWEATPAQEKFSRFYDKSKYVPSSFNYNPKTGICTVLTGSANKSDQTKITDRARFLYKRDIGKDKTWLQAYDALPRATEYTKVFLESYGFQLVGSGVIGSQYTAADFAFTFDGGVIDL